MTSLDHLTRSELLAYLSELAALPMFQHRPDLDSRRLLGLLTDSELLALVKDTVSQYKDAIQ